MIAIFVMLILCVFLFDFYNIRKQLKVITKQNEELIEILKKQHNPIESTG